MSKHTIYAVQAGANLIGAITRQSVPTGTTVRGEPTSGEVYARHQALVAQNPGASFSTMAIQDALDIAGLLGVDIDTGLTGSLNLFAHAHASGGTRGGASVHKKYAATKGMLYPVQLSADLGGDASLDYEARFLKDGANAPLISTDDVSLPAGIDDNERFTLGPMTLESVSLTQPRSFQIAFGINYVTEREQDSVWPSFGSIETIQPVITITGINVEWLKAANIPLLGKDGSHANTTFYLRKWAEGSTFVADGTAEHIKFTAAGLAYLDPALDGSAGGDPDTVTLTMPLVYDGTLPPLVINTASAIT